MKKVFVHFSYILVVIFLCSFSEDMMCVNASSIDQGNGETRAAFDAALLHVWNDGSYDSVFQRWYNRIPERFSDCVENNASLSFPETVTSYGLLDQILSTNVITLGYFGPVATLPGFDIDEQGVVVGGFYPDLAQLLVDRISQEYDVSIQVEWFEITTVSGFYSDHYAGVYDVIFMNLFKTAMWSDPVAPRNELWDFSCGLLTAEPLRYYVCPLVLDKGLEEYSISKLNNPSIRVEFISGGAQEQIARSSFPDSTLVGVGTLSELLSDCENGITDVIVELPDRVVDQLDSFAVDSVPLGTYNNTGAAFRFDSESEPDSESESESESEST